VIVQTARRIRANIYLHVYFMMSDCNNKRQRSSSPSPSDAALIEEKKPRDRRSRFSDKTAVVIEPQEPPVVATDITSILNARLMGMNPAYDGLLGNVDISQQQTATSKESRELFVGNVLATISDVILKDFLNRYFTVLYNTFILYLPSLNL
jgi:hypothetical protein